MMECYGHKQYHPNLVLALACPVNQLQCTYTLEFASYPSGYNGMPLKGEPAELQ